MPYLIAGLVLVGLLSLLNLALTLALARRLGAATPAARGLPPRRPGDRVAEFAGMLDDTGLVAFLAPSCLPCQEQRPQVLAYARECGPGRVVAVIVDDNEDPAEVAAEVAAFEGAARVVVAHTGDRMTTAFGVDAYPALFLVNADGTVIAAGHDVESLPRPAHVS